ncbi:Fic family protein (plasmid) [Lactobacillus sp. ESL0731]|uniref:Fic family protein n=1 Tax=unclassified Lactobacillus TaxID=2620435 RepID=UPI0023F7B00F|nr:MULTISPECIES: Fic family protein [unclassified Lactobacillus]WEV52124.1 Fic family protein [Lactobacillus sp. ESL0700]WEV63243.1 Fic family protein [Lactobacillus sp. ESL0731]
MEYKDKFQLTPEENRRFAKTNLTKLVFTNSRFEGLTTTLPQTQTIIDGMGVNGVSVDDINVIVQLKRGWQLAINYDQPFGLDFEKEINKIVARDTAAFPGYLRNGSGGVETYRGEFTPPMINEQKEKSFLNSILNSDRSATDKAMTVMYHNMRQQMFYDGNKRTATIAANKIMIENGAGLINIPLDQWPTWNQKIADYYFSNDMSDLKDWTYQTGISGIEPNILARSQNKVTKISHQEQQVNNAEFKQLLKDSRKENTQAELAAQYEAQKQQQKELEQDGPELE